MVKDIESLREMMGRVREAQAKYSTYTQEQVDKIFRKVAQTINDKRILLATMAVEETGMGLIEDKVIKNHFASEYIYNKYKDEKTCGVLEEDKSYGVKKVATPIGVIAGVIPTTNPTSTAIFKILLALKTRNAIIISPHPRAKNSTIYAARLAMEVAKKYGAPDDIISWIDEPSMELSRELMAEVDLILATGGPGMVKSAYSSGTPAIGVGAGNTPVIIDESADIKMTVNYILLSKTFDNGVICASEQAVILPESKYDIIKKEFIDRGAYVLAKDEIQKVRDVMFVNGGLNADIVGQSAYKIAKMAGLNITESSRVLIGEVDDYSDAEAFAHEKLSPILAMYKAKNFKEQMDIAKALVELGGLGHTSCIYIDLAEQEKIDQFGREMKTGRTLVNMPASLGAIGDVFNFKLEPSLTLGCGSWGGNSVSENVGVKHLLNIKTVAERRENMLWFKVPEKVYFKYGSLPTALEELKGEHKKAFIVTDMTLAELGYTNHITRVLDEIGIDYRIFSEVGVDPTLSSTQAGARAMREFKPDVIIALGGGSAMDAAKIMWVLYEHPTLRFRDLAMRFMDIRKRIVEFPEMGKKAKFIAVATSAGTGSEVTSYSVVTKGEHKIALANDLMLPDVALLSTKFLGALPAKVVADTGMDVLTHALEAYVSTNANPFASSLAIKSIKLIFENLVTHYNDRKIEAPKENVQFASCMAGIAFDNSSLGINHSIAHTVGAKFHIAHGRANAIIMPYVIEVNTEANKKYYEVSRELGLPADTIEEGKSSLLSFVRILKEKLGIEKCLKDYGVDFETFKREIPSMLSDIKKDICTIYNPNKLSDEEYIRLLVKIYFGQ